MNPLVSLVAAFGVGACGVAAHEFRHTIPLRIGGYPFSYQTLARGPEWLPPVRVVAFGGAAVSPEISPLRIPHRTWQCVALAPVVLIGVGYVDTITADTLTMHLVGLAITVAGLPSLADLRFLFGIGRQELAIEYAGAHYQHRLAEGVPDPWIQTQEF